MRLFGSRVQEPSDSVWRDEPVASYPESELKFAELSKPCWACDGISGETHARHTLEYCPVCGSVLVKATA
jgi:hypothetical protein